MPRATPGRVLLSAVGLATAVGCWVADYSDTHIFNPLWMPHAIFHTGQTISMGTCLGLSTLWYTWTTERGGNSGSRPSSEGGDIAEVPKQRLDMAVWLAAMYWLTQLAAWTFPNSAPMDPPADPWQFPYPQLYLGVGMLSAIGLGWQLEARRLKSLQDRASSQSKRQ